MLSWTQRPDGWYANGFRIELRAPRHWVLMDVDSETDVEQLRVAAPPEPLATETTLSQCKRQAAILAEARDRARLRRQHARILLLTLATAVLLFGQSPMINTGVILVAFFVISRSLGIVVSTWARNTDVDRSVFYQ